VPIPVAAKNFFRSVLGVAEWIDSGNVVIEGEDQQVDHPEGIAVRAEVAAREGAGRQLVQRVDQQSVDALATLRSSSGRIGSARG
jgi:hypothetical protein